MMSARGRLFAACVLTALMTLPCQNTQPARAKNETKLAAPLTLPTNFIDESVIGGLARPRAFTFAPDGRIFVLETGDDTSLDINIASIRVFKNGQLLAQRAYTFDVCGDGERGLLGIALDPDFASNGFLYVYYTRQSGISLSCGYNTFTANQPGPRNRVSRLKMVGDVVQPGSERVLIDTISTDSGIHNAGDLHFGADGYLYISVGESNFSTLAQPLNNLNGKILRIKPSTNDALCYSTTDNPFDSAAGAQTCGNLAQPFGSGPCREVYAYGFRNPFRFAIQSGSDNIFVGDVGGGAWEEVDKLAAGGNYGWLDREGPCTAGTFCAYPPLTPSGYADPIYAYPHTGGGAAVTGGAFIPSNSGFPAEYRNNYVLVDGYKGFMRRLVYDAQSSTWNPVAPDFSPDAFGVISLQAGPDGNLYYLFLDSSDGRTSELRRIRFGLAENAPPVANIAANPISSPMVNAVFTFWAAGSTDPDFNLPLVYRWDFGDGITATTSAVTVTHQYASAGAKNVSLVVQDSGTPPTSSAPATVQVFPGNTPPTATLVLTNVTAPARSQYYAGDTWAFSVINISDDKALPASALNWSVVFHHEHHIHPFLSNIIASSGQFTIPTTGETSPDVWYRVQLQITDSDGLTTTLFSDVLPTTTTVQLNSAPAGAQLQIDSVAGVAPFTVTRVVGIVTPVNVISPALQFQGDPWQFVRWSDGGLPQHTITVTQTMTLTAIYSSTHNLNLPIMNK